MAFLQNFHHQRLGSTAHPKLVFLHGLMGAAANWRRIAAAFQDRYEVLVYDQRGHGQSFRPETGYAPENYAEDLLKIIDELGWEKIHLVGHSMGGRNSIAFASRWPQRLVKLVVEDIGPEGNLQNAQKLNALIDGVPTPFPSRKEAKEFFLNEFPRKFADRKAVLTLGQFLYSNIVETSDGRADWRFSVKAIRESVQEGRARDRWDQWKAITTETLLVRGSESDEISPETMQEMLAQNHHARGIVIEKAGHWVHFEQPEAFIQCVSDFLHS